MGLEDGRQVKGRQAGGSGLGKALIFVGCVRVFRAASSSDLAILEAIGLSILSDGEPFSRPLSSSHKRWLFISSNRDVVSLNMQCRSCMSGRRSGPSLHAQWPVVLVQYLTPRYRLSSHPFQSCILRKTLSDCLTRTRIARPIPACLWFLLTCRTKPFPVDQGEPLMSPLASPSLISLLNPSSS